MNGTSVMYI